MCYITLFTINNLIYIAQSSFVGKISQCHSFLTPWLKIQILGTACLMFISHHDAAFFFNERLTSRAMLFLCPTSVHNGLVFLLCYMCSYKTFSMVRPSLFVSDLKLYIIHKNQDVFFLQMFDSIAMLFGAEISY